MLVAIVLTIRKVIHIAILITVVELLVVSLSYGQALNKFNSIVTNGEINVGGEHGFLPFLVAVNPPQTNFKTNGNVGLNVFKLLFNVSYHYSSLGSISGLNNHFTVDFDAQKFLQEKKNKLQEAKLNREIKIDSLNGIKQVIKKKIDYLYLLKDGSIKMPSSQGVNINKPNIALPKLDRPSSEIDLPEAKEAFKDTLPSLNKDIDIDVPSKKDVHSNQKDSLGNLIDSYTEKVEELEAIIAKYKMLNEYNIDSLAKSPSKEVKSYKDKITNLFSGVKKFNVGLTYPSYSNFLIARTPVRGVNLEYNLNKYYIAFTHGKTVNNLFLTNNVLHNTLNVTKNLYNFFDFNNVESGRRVTAIKVGYGEKENTHLYVGALYGRGKVSYQDTSIIYDSEENLVAELDFRLRLKSIHILDVVIGKSATQVIGDEGTNKSELLKSISKNEERTNGVLAAYKLEGKSSSVKFTFRLVDPFFRSLGLGFIKSDNIRYEIKAKQKIGKKINASVFYRRENDNLLSIYQYQNIISSYGAGVSYRPNRKWVLKADVKPLVLNVNQTSNLEDSMSFTNNNYIINFIANYNKRIKNTYVFATGVYSYYQLTFDDVLNIYQNTNLTVGVNHKEAWLFDLIYNNYISNDTETVPLTNTIQSSFTGNYKKISIGLLGKSSFTNNQKVDFGYGIKFKYKITKLISLGLSGEKLVLGDFYNSIYQNNLNTFPYYFNLNLSFRW